MLLMVFTLFQLLSYNKHKIYIFQFHSSIHKQENYKTSIISDIIIQAFLIILYLILIVSQMKYVEPSLNPYRQNQLNALLIKNLLLNSVQAEPQGVSPMQQLNLLYDKQDKKDINQLRTILSKVLSYPSSQIAQLHRKANRIGDLDLKQFQIQSQNQSFKRISQDAKFCPCCGFILQDNKLGICVDIENINHMGVSTYLYFFTLKIIIYLLVIMFFVFSIYALVSNVISSNEYKQTVSQIIPAKLLSYQGFLAISLGSKQIHQTNEDKISFTVQCWLGVAMISIWGIFFGFIKQKQRLMGQQIDVQSKTASDFTILIQNFPSSLTQKQFENILLQYQANLGQIHLLEAKTPLKIIKINKAKPFYLDQTTFQDERLTQIKRQFQQYRQKFVSWIEQRIEYSQFSQPQDQRIQKIKEFEKIRSKRTKIYQQIANNIKKQKKQQELGEYVPTFVTFQSNYNKQFLQYMHQDAYKIWSCLPFFDKSKYLYFKSKSLAIIKQAPQPQDIIWTNLGQPKHEFYKKRLLTFAISILVLGASFGSVYGLSKVQIDYSKTHNDSSNQYISILISLCVSIINIIIQQILRLLTRLQRNSTNTQHQVSLGLKAVIALLINSILIPILVNFFFKQNLYGVNGLAYDVFYLAITNSFLSPLLKIFDIYYYFTRLWYKFKNQPRRKLYMNQNQLNTICEYMEFQIGYQYIYIVNLFLFTCFFAPLQPVIVVFAVAGLFLMYWAQKYSLLNRCKRPAPGNNSINNVMYQLIYAGPAFYTVGSFCWSHFFKQSFIGIAPNLTAAIISCVIMLIPYRKLAKILFSIQPEAKLNYLQDRIFMPSQYDRLNPSTASDGIQDYMNYLADYKRKIKQKQQTNPKQIQSIQNMFVKQFGLGTRPHYQAIAPSLNNFLSFNNNNYFSQDQMIIQQLLGTNKNIFNPAMIGNAVLNTNNKLKMPTQNWFTNQESQVVNYLAAQTPPQQINSNIRFKMIDSKMIPLSGQQGFEPNQVKPITVNKNGDINFIYQAVANLAQQNDKKGGNQFQATHNQYAQQIPLNIPFNMFGSLLKAPQTIEQQKNPNLFEILANPPNQIKNQTKHQVPYNNYQTIQMGLMNNMRGYYKEPNASHRQPKY